VVTGTHFIDRLLYFWGFPDDVQLTDDSLGGPEANCEAEFRFNRDGVAFSGVARYSKSTNLPGGLVIETERGVVRLKDTTAAEIVFHDRTAGNIEQVLRRVGGPVFDPAVSEFQYQIEDFIRAVQTKSAPMVDGEQGLMSLRLIERLYAKRRLFSEDWYEQPAIEGNVWTK
jgi:predicted dehydrogenase